MEDTILDFHKRAISHITFLYIFLYFSARINRNLESNFCENILGFADDASYSYGNKLISELSYAMVHFGFVETARFHASLHIVMNIKNTFHIDIHRLDFQPVTRRPLATYVNIQFI